MKRKTRMPGGTMGIVASKEELEAREKKWKSSWLGRFLDSLVEFLFGGFENSIVRLSSGRQQQQNPIMKRLSEPQTRDNMAQRMKRVFRAGNHQQSYQPHKQRRGQLRRR